ncbi:MAG: phosphoribosylanthranilate isomerase [Lentisphaerae bacterium]|nr:phosphoribosylanthranilate isomerase [Lentisphaerota bacterium]
MHTLIKICGLTNGDDAKFAADAGADLLGFIFAPGSPRKVEPEKVREIVKQLPANVKKVGVFRDAANPEIISIMDLCGLDIVQLHGHETPETAKVLALEYEVWKAIPFTSSAAFAESLKFQDYTQLADSDKQGNDCNWSLAMLTARRRRLFLAGGIAVENAAHAVETVCPAGLDICSGVEKQPGIKDHRKITEIINRIRKADRIQEEIHEKHSF